MQEGTHDQEVEALQATCGAPSDHVLVRSGALAITARFSGERQFAATIRGFIGSRPGVRV
jgi:hypothetical protein